MLSFWWWNKAYPSCNTLAVQSNTMYRVIWFLHDCISHPAGPLHLSAMGSVSRLTTFLKIQYFVIPIMLFMTCLF